MPADVRSASKSNIHTGLVPITPALTAAANLTVNDVLPRTWRVSTAIAGTTPAVTTTIAASVVV